MIGDYALTPHLARKRSRRSRNKYRWVDSTVTREGSEMRRLRYWEQSIHVVEDLEAMGRKTDQSIYEVEDGAVVLLYVIVTHAL